MRKLRTFAVLLMVALGAMAANAKSSMHGKFILATATRWGQTVLPTGAYTFAFNVEDSTVTIRSIGGKTSDLVQAVIDNATSGQSGILIRGSGKSRQVSSVNLPQFGLSLVFLPTVRHESRDVPASAGNIALVTSERK